MKRIIFAFAALIALAAGCTQEIDPSSVSLNKHDLTLNVGGTAKLEATIEPANATNTALSWSSTAPAVATVDNNGTVTAVSEGQAIVTVVTLAGGKSDACVVKVSKSFIPVTGVRLDKKELKLTTGGGYSLTATVEPSDATDASVSWSSSNSDVASVDADGHVSALSEGTATISVKTTDGGFTASCAVTVAAEIIAVTGVRIEPEELTLSKGETATLQWFVEPENATDKNVDVSTSDGAVATVSGDGVVTAVGYGTATISVKTTDGGFTASCEVTVPAVPEGLTIEPASVEIAEGATVQLSATISPAGASQEVQWAALNSGIATVSAGGLVTGISEGTTKIYARSVENPDIQGECAVTVVKDPTLRGIGLNPTELNLTVGQTYGLQVLYTPEYAANKNVSWTTDNTAVASVSAEGMVTALTEGSATITATSEEGGFTASCAVTVSKVEGVKVYCSFKHELLVNGQPDPLSGAFDEENFRFDFISAICSDGSDLYSLEAYYNWWDNEYLYYLCKNRRPLYKINKEKASDNLRSMDVRGGKTALVFRNSSKTYVVIVNADGTSSSTSIPCDYTLDDLSGAVSPSGDLYVAATYQDAFSSYHLVLYKYTPDGQWSETELSNGSSYMGYVQVSDSGDVYVLTTKNFDGYDALLYKNQESPSVCFHSPHYFQHAFHVAGEHVCMAVIEFGNTENTITEMRDGNVIRTYNTNTDQQFGIRDKLMKVTSSGDTYVATDNYIFKNGKQLYTFEDRLDCFCVVE